jgi:hypothetical protein
MYDALTTRYTFACPLRETASVPLSDFRRLERLEGTGHPVVYRVDFDCPCGGRHVGLVSHDELDWAPLGFQAGRFLNLLTDRIEEVGLELGDASCRRIEAGEWPWSFFCYPEDRPRPVFPSSFFLLAHGPERRGAARIGLAVRCPSCERTSLNLVSHEHVDVPFHNDAEIGVVEHLFADDAGLMVEEFRAQLYSASFDARRLLLDERA